jgi:hypothetical protein
LRMPAPKSWLVLKITRIHRTNPASDFTVS